MRSYPKCFCPAQSCEWDRRRMRRPPKYSPGSRISMNAFSRGPTAHVQTLERIPRPLASPEIKKKHALLEIKITFLV